MLGWSLTFLVISLMAAGFGLGGVAGTSMAVAKIIFLVFLGLFLIAVISRTLRGRPPL